MREKKDLYSMLVGISTGPVLFDTILTPLKNLGIEHPYDLAIPFLGIYLKGPNSIQRL